MIKHQFTVSQTLRPLIPETPQKRFKASAGVPEKIFFVMKSIN
jgi:hypothetical protein